MTKQRYEEICSFVIAFDNLPDGAFFALAEEQYGITIDDWAEYGDMVNAKYKAQNAGVE